MVIVIVVVVIVIVVVVVVLVVVAAAATAAVVFACQCCTENTCINNQTYPFTGHISLYSVILLRIQLQINTVDNVWQYLGKSLVPSLYHQRTKFIVDGTNCVVGSVRIRQLRVRSGIYQLHDVKFNPVRYSSKLCPAAMRSV